MNFWLLFVSRQKVNKKNVNFEDYKKYVKDVLETERTTLHISDGQRRIAFFESLTVEAGVTLSTPQDTVRYQYDNHLGSASLELDQTAATISYEEYHPFGTSSYKLHRNSTEVSIKRYRYVGKERDEETGLYYYGARYYAAWIARFVSVDPLQHKYPHYTPYQYAGNKPITFIDLDGLEEAKKEVVSPFSFKTTDQKNITFEDQSSENAFNDVYRLASDEFRARIDKLKASDVNYHININTEKFTGISSSDNLKGQVSYEFHKDPKQSRVIIEISSEVEFKLGYLADELTGAIQYEEGKMGFILSNNNEIKPIGYDMADEIDTKNQ